MIIDLFTVYEEHILSCISPINNNCVSCSSQMTVCVIWVFLPAWGYFSQFLPDSLCSPTWFSTIMDVPCLLCLCAQVMVWRHWPDHSGLYSVALGRHLRDCSLMPSLSIPPAMDGHSFSHSDRPQLDAGGFVLPPPMVTQISSLSFSIMS